MRKCFLFLAFVASIGFLSCSSDDDVVVDENFLQGKWIPNIVYIDALGADFEEVYPHQLVCYKDYLEIRKTRTAFAHHNTACEAEIFTDVYGAGKNRIVFNLLGFYVHLEIVNNTEDTLLLKGTGEDLKPLIPFLFPDLAEVLPPGDLSLVTIELEFSKEAN